jgi:nitrate/nitrite transporter NarK
MTYLLGGLAGMIFAAIAVEKTWYPPPDVHGVALGLLAAGILYVGAGAGVLIIWILRMLSRVLTEKQTK